MPREFDRRRSAPRAAVVMAWFCLPFALAAQAQDAAAGARSAGGGLDVPLPPYPPSIFGLEVPAKRDSLRYSGAASSSRDHGPDVATVNSPSSSAPLSPPPPAAVESKPASSAVGETVLPPSTAAAVIEDKSPDVSRTAFAKVAESGLFPRLGKAERMAIAAFYDKRAFEPLWHVDGAPTKAALALVDRLAHAGEEGLDPDDYAAAATPAASTNVKDVAEAEWRLSAALVTYARDARGARVVPARLSGLITPTLALPDAEKALDTLTRATDASAALAAFNPRGDGYLNLRTALAKLRAEMIAPASAKSDGAENAQFASVAPETLKERHGSAVDQAATRAVSALSSKRIEADIIANMERWRWLPPDLGERYILVNVPEFTLRYVNNGVLAHAARVIVGKPSTPTPIFSGDMKFLVVNPSWYIPPSILKKEFLPKLADDPLYAERQGYEVVRRGDRISIRQPPGERNALGRIKFMFPNDHSVYLHDTPTRSLFAKADRAFSHGCVRVDQPFKLAEYVLNDQTAWPEKRIEKMIGGAERTINLGQRLAVHIAYFTLAADGEGRLHRFGDLYSLDTRLEAMLMPRK